MCDVIDVLEQSEWIIDWCTFFILVRALGAVSFPKDTHAGSVAKDFGCDSLWWMRFEVNRRQRQLVAKMKIGRQPEGKTIAVWASRLSRKQ